jgi:hypothetical protein
MKAYLITVHGFKISYDPGIQQFILDDSEDQEMGRAGTQEELEIAAQKLSKTNWDRWHVVVNARAVSITSFNPIQKQGWLVDDESGQRQEFKPQWMKAYPRTLENNVRLKELTELRSQLDDLHRKISELERGFTGEFTMTDFETHAKESKTPMKKREGT